MMVAAATLEGFGEVDERVFGGCGDSWYRYVGERRGRARICREIVEVSDRALRYHFRVS